MDELRLNGAKSTKLQSLVESMRFVTYVIGLGELTSPLVSRRCIGVSKTIEPSFRGQASPLSVKELKELHRVLESTNEDIWDRMFCGAFLALV